MGYTLIISEKPSAAQKIASALAEGTPSKENKFGVNNYRFRRKGKELVVAPAVGHLFGLSEKAEHPKWTYPVFSVGWSPTYERRGNAWAKKYYQNMSSLAKGADSFISACDYDHEGSVIARNILKYICNTEEAKRMKFSTLTKVDIEEAYDNASPELDKRRIEAGLTRHYLDYYWGINISRALTLALKAAGGFKVLSTGRVQGPTLKILEDREKDIKSFKPEPFWELYLNGTIGGDEVTALHVEDKFWDKAKAEGSMSRAQGKGAVVEELKKGKENRSPPYPFDLTTLQRESYRNFGYSPKMTLDIAQGLYEKALISYPRTSSQKLPAKLGLKTIIKLLSDQPAYQSMANMLLSKPDLRPNEGKKTDPAHPSIFPTGQKPKAITQYQRKVYDMIVKRFFAVFGEPAVRENMKLTINANGELFATTGTRTLKPGWMELYHPYSKLKEQILPEVTKGQAVDVKKIWIEDKETQPPGRYSQSSIIHQMEKMGIGTKATRAGILDTLYTRDYIKENSIHVTKLGDCVINALEKYCNEIISVEMTKEFDGEMEKIEEGDIERQAIVDRAEKELKVILEKFREHEKEIGTELLAGLKQVLKEESTVGNCKCGKELVIRFSRNKKRFVGCTGYPKCTETFSLPQHGYITILSETCKHCGLHVLQIRSKGKRPWKLCIRCGFVNKRKVPAKEGAKEGETAGKATVKPSGKAKSGKPSKVSRASKTGPRAVKASNKKPAGAAAPKTGVKPKTIKKAAPRTKAVVKE